MSLLIYIPAFWIVAIVSTILQNRYSDDEKELLSLVTVIKFTPALISVIFILLAPPSLSLFYILLAVALVFCMFGDIAMEIDLVPGIGMFLIGHVFFIIDFVWHAGIVGLNGLALIGFSVCMAVMIFYDFLLIRFLRSSGPEVPPFILRAGTLYFILLSATLSAAVLLWLSTGAPLGFIPVNGAFLFVLSDSLIGINEFRERIPQHELYIMSTYYLAIFLLTLSAYIYVF
ncbi:MAG: lysoplasmalogenase family protein [Candidatus Thorarchaeota archaeon]|jgi:uncharacterized membrane protein YhhN